MAKDIDAFGYFDLTPQEKSSETSHITAAMAGIASGVIKVPEGVVSLGAELIDLGFDTDIAAKVEKIFDEINIFEEVADDRAIGKIAETLIQVGVPGGIGFKLASGAVKAKKAGNYMNAASGNLQKAAKMANDFNKKLPTRKFVAGMAGGVAGEAFVANVEEIGSFGDVFEAGPTQLEETTDEGGREDAGRKLMNRLKFGAESPITLLAGYGAGKAIKAAVQRGKRIEFSNSKLDKYFNKIFSALRARGAKPQEIFESKMAEKGAIMSDTNRAMELVKNIDRQVDSIFPMFKGSFDKSNIRTRAEIYKTLNDVLFSDNIGQNISKSNVTKVTQFLKSKGAKGDAINEIFKSLNGARQTFTELIRASSNAPKDIKTLQSLMGSRVKDYLGNTYRIFEDKSILPYMSYAPTEEAIKNTQKFFKDYAAKNGKKLTDFQAETMVNTVIKSAQKQKGPPSLPFKYVDDTAADEGPELDKFFKNILTDQIKPERILAETKGKDKATIQALFGKMEDPRFSIYNSMTKLSAIARKNELFEKLAKQDDAVKKAVTKNTPAGARGFFFDDALEAAEALPNQDIVELDKFLLPFFKDEFTVNPLAGKFTSRAIAEGLGDSQKAFKFLFEPSEDSNIAVQGATWAYRNLVLFPKAASQVAKTILAPVTHFRNLFSATGFSAANGIFFENPAVVGRSFADAFGPLQTGAPIKRAIGKITGKGFDEAAANRKYRKLLDLGVVNSQVQIGDVKNLLRDVRFGENLNLEKPLESMMKKLTAGTARKAKGFMKGAEDLYTAEDDLFKIANFAVERLRLKNALTKANRTFTEDFLDQEAANIVRNTVPNYAYVSDTVKALRRLPLGTFMSFPSEILRTTTNIAQRSLKEIKDPALRSIGIKRLTGLGTVLYLAPNVIQSGFQIVNNVTNEQLQAMKQYLPDWSKNSTIIPIRSKDGELKYVDFSHGNAYDVATRPIQTLINEVQRGITDEEVLMKGVLRGMTQAAGELASPFISEAIYTEAMLDIITRKGRTKEGRELFNDEVPFGEQIDIMVKHLAKSLAPLSYPQLTRLYQAAADKPSKSGEFFELPDELGGFIGYRTVKLDPIRSINFKIAEYERGIRNSRKLFTGGDQGVLKGGPKTPKDVIERFFVSNKARFKVQKEMLKNIEAANILGTDMRKFGQEFSERGLGKTYGRLRRYDFDPYFPSKDIFREFEQISRRIGEPNPMRAALGTIRSMSRKLNRLRLDGEFNLDLDDYLPDTDLLGQAPLPPTPAVDPAVVQPGQQASLSQTGLTPTEQALLSPEEQAIRLRQRGMA